MNGRIPRLQPGGKSTPCVARRGGAVTETSQTVPDRIGPDAWTKVQNMPWTTRLELRRRVAWPLVRAQFAWHGVAWGADWKIFGRPIIQRHRGSRIALGDGLTLRSWQRSHPLALTAPVVLSTRRRRPQNWRRLWLHGHHARGGRPHHDRRPRAGGRQRLDRRLRLSPPSSTPPLTAQQSS